MFGRKRSGKPNILNEQSFEHTEGGRSAPPTPTATRGAVFDDPGESRRLSEGTALVMTIILATPFAVVFILPILLSNFGMNLNPLNRYGGLWGAAGAGGYVTFVGFGLAATGVNWVLKSINKWVAVSLFTMAVLAVAGLFLALFLDYDISSSSASSEYAPASASELRETINDLAADRGVETVSVGEAENAIKSVCPAIDDGLTIGTARSDMADHKRRENISDADAERILLMTETVIEHSDSLC